jgi:hypothetical protein
VARDGRPGKLTKGGGDTGRPSVTWTFAVDGGRLVASLPILGGRGSKTRGVFVGPDLREQPLISEENPHTKALAARVGLTRSWAAETHVESHAAEAMHRLGLTDAILAVNHSPAAACRAVMHNFRGCCRPALG